VDLFRYRVTDPSSHNKGENFDVSHIAEKVTSITDPKVQSQLEDGSHIGPKHIVVIILL